MWPGINDRLYKWCKLIGHGKELTSNVRKPQLTWVRASSPDPANSFASRCSAAMLSWRRSWQFSLTLPQYLQEAIETQQICSVQNVQAYRPISFAKKADEIARPGSTVVGRFWSNACHLITLASGNGLTDTKGESVNQLFRSSCNAHLGSKEKKQQEAEKSNTQVLNDMLSPHINSVQMRLDTDGLLILT